MPIVDFNMEIRYEIVSINLFMIDSQKSICFKPASIHQLIVFSSLRMQTVSFFMLMLEMWHFHSMPNLLMAFHLPDSSNHLCWTCSLMPVHYTTARSKHWSLNNNVFFFTKLQSRYSWRHAPGSGLNWVPSNFTSTELGCCKERFVPLCCAKQAEYVRTVCRLAWNRMADLLSLRGEKKTRLHAA